MTDQRKQLAWAIALGIGLILLPLGIMVARSWGWIEDAENELPSRVNGIAISLIVAAYGNIAPRKLVRYDPASPRAADKQAAIRFSGWVFVLAGLAGAAVWAFVSPIDRAAFLSMIPFAAALLLVFLRCSRLKTKAE